MLFRIPQIGRLTSALLLAAAVAFPGGAAADGVRAGGTGSALKTLQVAGEAFARAGGAPVAVVRNLGSGGALKALRAGAIDVAVVAYPPTGAEAIGLRVIEYARTPFVFAVGTAPVERISLRQLVDLYSGKTARWPDGEPVRLVLRAAFDTDTAVMRAMAPALSDALDRALKRPGMVVAYSDQEAADRIATLPGGIGPTTLALIRSEGRPLKPLELDGVAPTLEALADGRYRHAKSYHAVVLANAPEAATRFVAFLRSPAARPLLEEFGQQQVAD